MKAAVAFLTTLGGSSAPTPGAFRWFPLVGALIGGVLAGVWWSSSQLWPPLVAAALVVTADLAITGMLHLDGLGDTADGLLPHAARERRLDIMRQPDIGSFGVGVVVMVLGLRVVGLGAIPSAQWRDAVLLIAIWSASRTMVAVIPSLVPYARSEGLASGFLATDQHRRSGLAPVVGIVPCAVLAWWSFGLIGLAAIAALLAAGAAVVAWSRRLLGGFTGDVLGAALMIGETVAIVIAATQGSS